MEGAPLSTPGSDLSHKDSFDSITSVPSVELGSEYESNRPILHDQDAFSCIANRVVSDDPEQRILDEKVRGIRTSKGANQLDPNFFEILKSLEKMSQLPEDHSFHLAKNVQLRASYVLFFLIHHYEILPKLLPENSDCLSFTWEDNDFKRFLSLDSNDADLTLLDKAANSTYIETLCEDGALDYEVINRALRRMVAGPLNWTSCCDAKR